MNTMEEIKQLKYDMLTLSNASRGYSNSNAVNDVTRVESELEALEAVYNNHIISDDLKDEYILSELNNIVWNVDDEQLAELLEDRDDESYYNDASIDWIYDYVHDLFYYDNTLNEIDYRIASIFGHYGNNYIVKNDGQYYIIFEW